MCHAAVASNFREFGQPEVAANVIGAALARFPDDGTILTEAARIATVQHRHGDALTFLERAIELFGPLPNLLSAKAQSRSELAEV